MASNDETPQSEEEHEIEKIPYIYPRNIANMMNNYCNCSSCSFSYPTLINVGSVDSQFISNSSVHNSNNYSLTFENCSETSVDIPIFFNMNSLLRTNERQESLNLHQTNSYPISFKRSNALLNISNFFNMGPEHLKHLVFQNPSLSKTLIYIHQVNNYNIVLKRGDADIKINTFFNNPKDNIHEISTFNISYNKGTPGGISYNIFNKHFNHAEEIQALQNQLIQMSDNESKLQEELTKYRSENQVLREKLSVTKNMRSVLDDKLSHQFQITEEVGVNNKDGSVNVENYIAQYIPESESLRAKLITAVKRSSKLESECSKLTSKIEEAVKRSSELEFECSKLSTKLVEAEKRSSELNCECTQLKTEFEEAGKLSSQLKFECLKLSTKLEETGKRSSELESECSKLRTKLAEAGKRNLELTDQMQITREILANSKDGSVNTSKYITMLESECENLRTKLTEADKRSSELESECLKLSNKLAEVEKRNLELNKSKVETERKNHKSNSGWRDVTNLDEIYEAMEDIATEKEMIVFSLDSKSRLLKKRALDIAEEISKKVSKICHRDNPGNEVFTKFHAYSQGQQSELNLLINQQRHMEYSRVHHKSAQFGQPNIGEYLHTGIDGAFRPDINVNCIPNSEVPTPTGRPVIAERFTDYSRQERGEQYAHRLVEEIASTTRLPPMNFYINPQNATNTNTVNTTSTNCGNNTENVNSNVRNQELNCNVQRDDSKEKSKE